MMNSLLQKALEHLENADYAKYFEELDKIEMPDLGNKNAYSALKKTFIWQSATWEYTEKLQVFAQSLIPKTPNQTADQPLKPIVDLPTFSPADFDNLAFSHALRPSLCKNYLYQMAMQSQCLNIFGEKGSGKGRLLRDMAKTNLPHTLFVVEKVQKSFDLFLKSVAQSLGVKAGRSLHEILENAAEKQQKYVFLLIEGIDELYDETGKAYEGYADFFVQLRGLTGTNFCRVACTSVLAKGAHFETVSSPLTYTRQHLRELLYNEIDAEISRIFPFMPENLRNTLADQCASEPQAYELLETLSFEQPDLSDKNQIFSYLKTYRKGRK